MGKKRDKNSRRASRKLKELLRDKPFGVGAESPWDNSYSAYSDSDGDFTDSFYDDEDEAEDEDDYEDEDEEEGFWSDAHARRQPLDFN